jgi:hypothetical protein
MKRAAIKKSSERSQTFDSHDKPSIHAALYNFFYAFELKKNEFVVKKEAEGAAKMHRGKNSLSFHFPPLNVLFQFSFHIFFIAIFKNE